MSPGTIPSTDVLACAGRNLETPGASISMMLSPISIHRIEPTIAAT